MTPQQKEFLDHALVHQEKYKDIAVAMNVPEKQLSSWWEELKPEREVLAKIRAIWLKKCKEIDFWKFHLWYTTHERTCHYCGIDEATIARLIDNHLIYTKRIITRGRSLEIDRKKPNEAYDNTENLVWCCYWCNNAKTDEFNEEEFKQIGMNIGETLRNRLNTQILNF